jgi:hypothetical protein
MDMKIQVGKTYTDGNGAKYLIECRLKNPLAGAPAGSFLGTHCSTPGFNVYNEDGTIAHQAYSNTGTLLPNIVKKKGWIARGVARFTGVHVANVGMNAYATKEEAADAYPNAAAYHEIEWEEEEET